MASIFLKTLSFIALFLKLVHSQDHTYFSYHTFSPPDGLTLQGGAHVPSGSNNLCLTQLDVRSLPQPLTVGRALFYGPIKLWERESNRQATIETTIKFRIKPSSYTNGSADGLAFFIAPVNTNIPSGATGGNLGIFNDGGIAPTLFAVEFDTYVNSWDPNFRHIGINIESRESKDYERFDSGTGEPVTATIMYRPDVKTISVIAECGTQQVSLEYDFDLTTILPEVVQVGISSATGAFITLQGVHELISWTFFSDLDPYTEVKAYIQHVV